MNARSRPTIDFLVRRYLTVDARTLGLFRIVFGLHLICNLYDRTQGPDGVAFYTNEGVMPNHYALFAPAGDKIWSLLFPFSTPSEVQVAFLLIFLVYFFYVVGYRTKLFQILAVVCLLSLDNRNLHLQNGGIVVTNIVAIWTAFLPLGARFSVDHLLRSLRTRVETSAGELRDRAAMVASPPSFVRLAFFGIVLNFAVIYFFNCVHKHGGTWRDGSAVHWVLWQNRINTIWAALLRMHEPSWFSPVSTWATLIIEIALPGLLLAPVAWKWPRRLAILFIFALHGFISLLMTLGPFSYSMMSFSLLLIGPDDWAFASRFWWSKRKLAVLYDPTSGIHQRLARVLARLDARRALEFGDIRAPEPDLIGDLTAERADDLGAKSFVVWLRPTPSRGEADKLAAPILLTGSAAAAAVVSALPLGPVYAWLLKVPSVSRWAESLLARRDTEDFSEEPAVVESPAARFKARVLYVTGEILTARFFLTVVIQVGVDNWAIPDRYRVKNRPEVQRQIVEYLRVPQGWSMFSPEAPRDDGTITIDAVLSDGSHIDPRKQAPPDFEPAYHGPWYDDQQWCDWDLRMRFDGNRHLHPHFRDYIARLDKFRSWKQRAKIVYFDVYWVNNAAPPPGSTRPYNITKQLLFSGGTRP